VPIPLLGPVFGGLKTVRIFIYGPSLTAVASMCAGVPRRGNRAVRKNEIARFPLGAGALAGRVMWFRAGRQSGAEERKALGLLRPG